MKNAQVDTGSDVTVAEAVAGEGVWSLHVLGTGAASAVDLGSSGAVLEHDGKPMLLVDCGPGTLDHYLRSYGSLPAAVFITHGHMDHVAGLERLFHAAWFGPDQRGCVKLFMHANLVPILQARVADYPNAVAEGGANFWEGFKLIPLSRGFWLDDWWFDVFATRHHVPGTSFGVTLRGCFAWTGDTRPIPELLAAMTDARTLVAHDCRLIGNPSHAGADDLEREYPDTLRERLLLYHYGSEAEIDALRARGFKVAVPDGRYPLNAPQPVRVEAG
ncbi:MAG TPA: MBL fold metallo-hydrolase [Rhodanobacteraceae bacterium]|nr:MBL fold metallo-hydrolase [Rhodanobacteraceae bacterium]